MAAIHAVRHAHTALHRRLATMPDQELSLADMLVLHQIAHGEGATPGQIAIATGLTSGAVTGLIDRLESRGLIVRRRSSHDRRVVIVSLAPDARSRLAAMMDATHREAARMFEGWDLARLRTLVGMLEDLAEATAPPRVTR